MHRVYFSIYDVIAENQCEKHKKSSLGHDLPTSLNDRVISPFRKGFIFTKLHMRSFAKIKPARKRSYAKIKPSRNFPNLSFF